MFDVAEAWCRICNDLPREAKGLSAADTLLGYYGAQFVPLATGLRQEFACSLTDLPQGCSKCATFVEQFIDAMNVSGHIRPQFCE
jgi:hypothetical protein